MHTVLATPRAGGRFRFAAAVAAARRLPCGARDSGASKQLALSPAHAGLRCSNTFARPRLWRGRPPSRCAPRRRRGAAPATRPRRCQQRRARRPPRRAARCRFAQAWPGGGRRASAAPRRRARTRTVQWTVRAWRATGPHGPVRPARPGLRASARSAPPPLTCRTCLSVESAANAAGCAAGLETEHRRAVGPQGRPSQSKRSTPPGHACARSAAA